MIRLAMELPTAKLKEWSPLADLDFVLAHQVLNDKAYAEYFKRRRSGRELILDNSLHELGFPLAIGDLKEAACRCRADYVIAPDKAGDVEFNAEQFKLCQPVMQAFGFKTAVVKTGDGILGERFLSKVILADMLCLTFKDPNRLQAYSESKVARSWGRIHLLGLDSLKELRKFCSISNRAGASQNWSLDTAKALKWAIRRPHTSIEVMNSLRFAGQQNASKANEDSINLLNLQEVTDLVEERFKDNVRVLKEHMQ